MVVRLSVLDDTTSQQALDEPKYVFQTESPAIHFSLDVTEAECYRFRDEEDRRIQSVLSVSPPLSTLIDCLSLTRRFTDNVSQTFIPPFLIHFASAKRLPLANLCTIYYDSTLSFQLGKSSLQINLDSPTRLTYDRNSILARVGKYQVPETNAGWKGRRVPSLSCRSTHNRSSYLASISPPLMSISRLLAASSQASSVVVV